MLARGGMDGSRRSSSRAAFRHWGERGLPRAALRVGRALAVSARVHGTHQERLHSRSRRVGSGWQRLSFMRYSTSSLTLFTTWFLSIGPTPPAPSIRRGVMIHDHWRGCCTEFTRSSALRSSCVGSVSVRGPATPWRSWSWPATESSCSSAISRQRRPKVLPRSEFKLVAALGAAIERLHNEAIPCDTRRLAEDLVVEHRASWRLRNLVPEPADVEKLADAWLAGHPVAAEVQVQDRLIDRIEEGDESPRAQLAEFWVREPETVRRVARNPEAFRARFPGASEADVNLVAGEYNKAIEEQSTKDRGRYSRLHDMDRSGGGPLPDLHRSQPLVAGYTPRIDPWLV